MIRRRRVTMQGYRAATRLSRKARSRARHHEVDALDQYKRRATYYRQNGCERLTPRQRRRVLQKENAGRGQ